MKSVCVKGRGVTSSLLVCNIRGIRFVAKLEEEESMMMIEGDF